MLEPPPSSEAGYKMGKPDKLKTAQSSWSSLRCLQEANHHPESRCYQRTSSGTASPPAASGSLRSSQSRPNKKTSRSETSTPRRSHWTERTAWILLSPT